MNEDYLTIQYLWLLCIYKCNTDDYFAFIYVENLSIDVAVIQMCRMYRLSGDSMVEEWVAFCSTKKLDKKRVTIDMLDHLDREVKSFFLLKCYKECYWTCLVLLRSHFLQRRSISIRFLKKIAISIGFDFHTGPADRSVCPDHAKYFRWAGRRRSIAR